MSPKIHKEYIVTHFFSKMLHSHLGCRINLWAIYIGKYTLESSIIFQFWTW